MTKLKLVAGCLLLAGCAHPNLFRSPSSETMSEAQMVQAPTVACTAWSDQVSPAQQRVINSVMGTRSHRLHHALWHATRGGLSATDQSTLVTAFGASWSQFHPLCPAPQFQQTNYDPAGEDFLYMHHQMIGMLQTSFVEANLPCIKGFSHVPTPKEWALPANSVLKDAKSPQTLLQLQAWDAKFRDPQWLKTHTLSQVGWALEYSVHNNLHMRYASDAPPKGFDADGAPLSLDGHFPAGWIYDQPAYNWLADPYGAALNPTFWKIHGYVDSILDQWLSANGFDRVAEECAGDAKCYTWQGRWTGELATPPDGSSLPRSTAPRPHTPAEVRDRTRRRLDIQRIGVLKDGDFTRSRTPRVGASPSPSNDPWTYTQSRLCHSH